MTRYITDHILAEKTWQRVKFKYSDLNERANAWFVTNSMKAKMIFGLGQKEQKHKKRKNSNRMIKLKFTATVRKTLKQLKEQKLLNINDAVKIAQKI